MRYDGYINQRTQRMNDMAHASDLDNLEISDLLAGITRRVGYLEGVDALNRRHREEPLRGADLPGIAEAYALLTDLVEKMREGEI